MGRPTIECTTDGPYRVSNLDTLRDGGGQRLATKPVLFLCRCGGSSHKPFCDGTHKKNGFSGAKLADRTPDVLDSYGSGRFTIHDNRAICAHSGHCTDSLGAVFASGREPWIDPAGAAIEASVATIRGCPSGALRYTLDGQAAPARQRAPAIASTRDGPYAVVGGVELQGEAWAEGASTEHYTLCRCGASKNKPFCDGSHWRVGFRA